MYDAVAVALAAFPGAKVIESDDLGDYAVELACKGWAVFPLRAGQKEPRWACRTCSPRKVEGRPPPPRCPGPEVCGHELCHGVKDASNDTAVVADWWRRFPGSNIGMRVPDALVVLDVDPRHDGHLRLAEHEAEHGSLPATLTAYSGRGDGGRHLFLRRPPGKLTSKRLGYGIDLKLSGGYTIAPPSIHPDSGLPYRWELHEVAAPPRWLVELLQVQRPVATRVETGGTVGTRVPTGGPSIADAYSTNTSWATVLGDHRWECLDADPDADGARWLHPAATSACSATIRNGCLFVYSDNTVFEQTEAGDPHGYTRFRAYAVLNHHGNLSAAARALREAS